jgi:FO synthase
MRRRCDSGHGRIQTYSPKVFLPLTQLCRDVCHYCTFAHPRGANGRHISTRCSAGDRARGRSRLPRSVVHTRDKRSGATPLHATNFGAHDNTLSYLEEMCALVLKETGLLHVANGTMTRGDPQLRRVSVSQGLCWRRVGQLCAGGPHFGSPTRRRQHVLGSFVSPANLPCRTRRVS